MNKTTNRPYFLQLNLRRALIKFFFEYETPKIVSIQSSTFGILLRLIQIILLLFSVFYFLIYEKGYQKIDSAIISTVTLKVKGIGFIPISNQQKLIIDVADYIIPPSENNAIFIMTNFIRTDQRRSRCPESFSLKEAVCSRDSDCQNRTFLPSMNGLWTGRCLMQQNNSERNSTGLCEIDGWCPAENDRVVPMLVNDVLNFTIFVKNFIEFGAFGVIHKNLIEVTQDCVYHPTKNPNCPIFSLNYVLNEAEKDLKEQELILRYGGVIRVQIDWNCNLDLHLRQCKPVYSFARLDVPFREKPFSVGFNFRFASYWKEDENSLRTLTKVFGLRLIVVVSGKAGKFDFFTLTLNIGSLVGVFGLATFLCDVLLLYCSRHAPVYRKHVFEPVNVSVV